MVDDLKIRGPADAKRISLSEDHELRYWTTKFGCTVTELRLAVRAVGPMARNVEAHLKGVAPGKPDRVKRPKVAKR